ncbi:HD-GYP domain-containing protein [Oceanidesulfovibrio marinus]|uniref:HD domain-containing protein n=1 Tax=Oceanidesulfovibrio marinus TaxID=370038 RepID=A0A6P1ZFC5_9BACT|nr:HD domain-containing phosphohydrolase [Oceanidesulfovibrio marinus]QJT09285.1 HD domain-containing protein [Oceanidesulfovibrio marinus]TVM32780.1 HD family phosphohydrolase [Oceanidesulfovibrio marinus]
MTSSDANATSPLTGKDFFHVSPMLLFPETMNDFSVYLKHESGYTLYCHADERFTEKHRRLLYENGVAEVYVQLKEKDQFERYLEDHLGEILTNEALPLKERSRVLYSVSSSLVEETFRTRLPSSIKRESFERVTAMVRKGTEFLSHKDSLRAMASLISNHYQTYTHSVHVFVYATAMLQAYDLPREELVQVGLGAVLHDIGKSSIPRRILDKPGRLDREERELINTHPVQGVSLCATMPLAQTALNCILFHHERMDGKGYPSGMPAENIPLPVRVVTVCDTYDALTSDRPYAPALEPYAALKLMRDEMNGAFDLDVFKRLIGVLSDSRIV